MQIVVHTPLGEFKGPIDDFTTRRAAEAEEVLKALVADGNYFMIEDTGKGSKVVLPRGVIQQSVFELRKVK